MKESALELENVSLHYRARRSFFRHSFHTALDRVSFTVEKGETFGVIGGNGSGKSTLLKVLAGIYRPDSGTICCNCDHQMLLSLALGFLGELSGRENALLSGVLLGGSRHGVQKKMQEIIDFSELEGAIDDPLKTYSSGMRARLGFAVALKMQSELMLIDEVMGVGDAHFRQKAQAAMLERVGSDQTVILVSHSPGQVEKVCRRALWLHDGAVRMVGEASQVAGAYHQYVQTLDSPGASDRRRTEQAGADRPRLRKSLDGSPSNSQAG